MEWLACSSPLARDQMCDGTVVGEETVSQLAQGWAVTVNGTRTTILVTVLAEINAIDDPFICMFLSR